MTDTIVDLTRSIGFTAFDAQGFVTTDDDASALCKRVEHYWRENHNAPNADVISGAAFASVLSRLHRGKFADGAYTTCSLPIQAIISHRPDRLTAVIEFALSFLSELRQKQNLYFNLVHSLVKWAVKDNGNLLSLPADVAKTTSKLSGIAQCAGVVYKMHAATKFLSAFEKKQVPDYLNESIAWMRLAGIDPFQPPLPELAALHAAEMAELTHSLLFNCPLDTIEGLLREHSLKPVANLLGEDTLMQLCTLASSDFGHYVGRYHSILQWAPAWLKEHGVSDANNEGYGAWSRLRRVIGETCTENQGRRADALIELADLSERASAYRTILGDGWTSLPDLIERLVSERHIGGNIALRRIGYRALLSLPPDELGRHITPPDELGRHITHARHVTHLQSAGHPALLTVLEYAPERHRKALMDKVMAG